MLFVVEALSMELRLCMFNQKWVCCSRCCTFALGCGSSSQLQFHEWEGWRGITGTGSGLLKSHKDVFNPTNHQLDMWVSVVLCPLLIGAD